MTLCCLGTFLVFPQGAICSSAGDGVWQVGLGRADITPQEPILLSGYGGRDKPSNESTPTFL